MSINIRRGLLPRQANITRRELPIQRRPRIGEVFEDLATESVVELIVYEDFLDLNPQVREFPNLNPSEPVNTGEQGMDNNISQESPDGTVNGIRRTNRRDYIRDLRIF